MNDVDPNVTQLLRATAGGDPRQLQELLAAIYDDLHRLAQRHLRGERRDHTLQPTALVHEAYLRLMDQRSRHWNDRAHFLAVASTMLRRILLDHARERAATKRGGGRRRIPLENAHAIAGARDLDLLALDEALRELEFLDAQQAKIVELRFFGGLTIEEIASLLAIGKRSVDRHWQAAKAWLHCRLSESAKADGAPPT